MVVVMVVVVVVEEEVEEEEEEEEAGGETRLYTSTDQNGGRCYEDNKTLGWSGWRAERVGGGGGGQGKGAGCQCQSGSLVVHSEVRGQCQSGQQRGQRSVSKRFLSWSTARVYTGAQASERSVSFLSTSRCEHDLQRCALCYLSLIHI